MDFIKLELKALKRIHYHGDFEKETNVKMGEGRVQKAVRASRGACWVLSQQRLSVLRKSDGQ